VDRSEEIANGMMERLAAIEHLRWSQWHLHSQSTWTPDRVDRWTDLATTLYENLSEELKEKDREEVRSYLPMIVSALRAARDEALEEAAKLLEKNCQCSFDGSLGCGGTCEDFQYSQSVRALKSDAGKP
jgi:hypothetical protein